MVEKREIVIISEEPLVVLKCEDSQNNNTERLIWRKDFLNMKVGDKITCGYIPGYNYRIDNEEELECLYISDEIEDSKEIYCVKRSIDHCYIGNGFEKDDDRIDVEFFCIIVHK